MKRLLACVVLLFLVEPWIGTSIQGQEKKEPTLEPIATIHLDNPSTLMDQINQWFVRETQTTPAGLFAEWKRRSKHNSELGKPLEALIAAFNPEMARELKILEGAAVTFWLPEGTSDWTTLEWSVAVPKDDGTISAFVLASRVTDGASEEGLGDTSFPETVDRLGPTGAPLAIRIRNTIVIASSRHSLLASARACRDQNRMKPIGFASTSPNRSTCLSFNADSRILGSVIALSSRASPQAIAEIVNFARGARIHGNLTLDWDSVAVHSITNLAAGAGKLWTSGSPIDSSWFGWIPASEALGSVVLGIDSSAANWDVIFQFLDRLEKADPAKNRLLPVRSRINAFMAIAGVQPEVDLWPKLRGITLSALCGPPEQPTNLEPLVAIHTESDQAAERIRDVIVPKLVATYRAPNASKSKVAKPVEKSRRGAEEDSTFRIENLGGRPLVVSQSGSSVLISWGKLADLERSRLEQSRRSGSAKSSPVATLVQKEATRLVLFWPGRFIQKTREPKSRTILRTDAKDELPVIWYAGKLATDSRIEDDVIWRGIPRLIRDSLDDLILPTPRTQ